MLNSILIQIIVFVVLLAIAFIAIILYRNKCKEYKTLNTEHDMLRNRYNALQQDYTAYQFAMQKKEEAYAETQQALAETATANASTIANKLQNRPKKSVRNKDSSAVVHVSSTATVE